MCSGPGVRDGQVPAALVVVDVGAHRVEIGLERHLRVDDDVLAAGSLTIRSGRRSFPSPSRLLACSTKSQWSTMPASSTTRLSWISPQRPAHVRRAQRGHEVSRLQPEALRVLRERAAPARAAPRMRSAVPSRAAAYASRTSSGRPGAGRAGCGRATGKPRCCSSGSSRSAPRTGAPSSSFARLTSSSFSSAVARSWSSRAWSKDTLVAVRVRTNSQTAPPPSNPPRMNIAICIRAEER